MIPRPFLLLKTKMQLRLPNDPLQIQDSPYQYLYIHRTTESSRSASGKTQKQESVGRVLILPPIDSRGCAVGDGDRIILDLKKPLSEKEEHEVRTGAPEYTGRILAVGIAYAKGDTGKKHSCRVEVLRERLQ